MKAGAVVGNQQPQPIIGDASVHVDPSWICAMGPDIGMDHNVGEGFGGGQADLLDLLRRRPSRGGKRDHGVPRLWDRSGNGCERLAQTFQVVDAHLAVVEYPDPGESKRQ
jgi:hypothetical protein